MLRYIPLLTAWLLPAFVSAAGAALPITWSLDPVESRSPDRVQLTLEVRTATSNSSMSHPVWTRDLAGLDRASFVGTGAAPLHFTIDREAGRFDCDGTGGRSRGHGTCRFAHAAAFEAALDHRGIARPSDIQAFHLATAGVGLALIDELSRQGYAKPTLDELVAMAIQGVDAGYVHAIADGGFRLGQVDRLVAFRIQGVSPEWLQRMGDADPRLRHLSADDVLALRIQGVSPEWIAGLARLGYGGLTAHQLVAMRIQGISPDFVRRALAATSSRPTPDELVAMRISGFGQPR